MATSAEPGKDGKMYLKPKKGILKASSSFDRVEPSPVLGANASEKDHHMKWDEMNILATFHPPDKDYGHMKVEEPKTPFSTYQEPEEGVAETETVKRRRSVDGLTDEEVTSPGVDSNEVMKRLEADSVPKICQDEDEESSADESETPDERGWSSYLPFSSLKMLQSWYSIV